VGQVGVARADWCRRAGVSDGVYSDFAGNFAGLVATHAVGYNEKPLTGVTTIFVLLANSAWIALKTRYQTAQGLWVVLAGFIHVGTVEVAETVQSDYLSK